METGGTQLGDLNAVEVIKSLDSRSQTAREALLKGNSDHGTSMLKISQKF